MVPRQQIHFAKTNLKNLVGLMSILNIKMRHSSGGTHTATLCLRRGSRWKGKQQKYEIFEVQQPRRTWYFRSQAELAEQLRSEPFLGPIGYEGPGK
jgi:hypothetical protein